MKIKLWSNYSHELARELMVGELDLALITGIPENPKLSSGRKIQNDSSLLGAKYGQHHPFMEGFLSRKNLEKFR
jgi:hypothetical protein